MDRIIKLIISFLISIFTTLASAASTPNGDAVSQAYALSKTVQTSEHVPGISLLGGQILHTQPVISGKLPYVMSYVGSVRNSLSASNDYFDQFLTTGGWTDNYQNSVRFYSYNNSPTLGYYAIRVPGSRDDIWLSNINRSTCSGGVQRGFSSDVLGRLAYDNGANIVWACSTNGYQFTENIGGGITINYRGTLYKTTSNSISQSGTVYYRITSVKSPQGDQLNFTYDGSLNMLSVADNRNNKIVFSRNYAEKRLISQVELTSGIGNKQVGTFTYGSYNSQDANGKTGSIYYPTIINSTAIGTKRFEYTPIKQWGVDGYLRFKNVTISNTNAATLTSIKNITGQIQREWIVKQNYATYNTNTKTYATAQVTLQVRMPITLNDSWFKLYAQDYTVNYDDNARTVTLKTRANAGVWGGGDEGSVTYTINPKPVYKTSAEGVGYYDDGESEIIVSGDFPGLTVDGHVPSNIRMHSWYNYIKSVGTVKGLMVTQTVDTSGRPYQIIYTGTTIPTKTVTYIYGLLSNGTENSFLIPTITTSGNITITNIINENGQITKQSQSSLQSGSTTKSIEYAYYSDAAQPNYGLVNTVDGPKAGIGDKVTYTYDDFGNLASQYQTIKGIILTTSYIGYNNFAQPERIISPNSLVQLFVYNADGTVNTEINGIGGSAGAISGQTTSYTYNNLKQVVSKTNPDGDVTSYTYNLIGRLSGVLLPDKSVIVYSYYSNGILSDEAYSDGSNNIALVKNNVLGMNGRINRTYSGYNQNKLYTDYYYDRNGNLELSNTAEGIRELWSYDALNRLKAHTNGMGGIDTKDYDINNNIISAMDALNAGSNPLSYRNGNILTQEVNSDFGTKTYTYNEADQLTQRINVDRKCNYNSIDEIGRYGAFVCTSNSGTTPSEYQVNDNYKYDQSRYGRLDKVSSSVEYDVNTFYNYDVYDRITQKRQENLLWYVSAENKNLTVNYSYSIGGKQTKIILPSGRVIDYNYNLSTATLTGITLDGGALIRNITYDGANRVTGWLWGRSNASYNINYIANISSINTIFNKDNNGSINYSLTYGYDNDGRITSVKRNNSLNDTYKYDNANRLTLESRFNGNSAVYTVGYGYDANGNRTSLNATGSHLQPASSASYAYSGNKLTSFNKDGVAQALNYTANAEVAYGPFTAAYDNGGRRKADHASNYYYYMNYNHKNERITRGLSSNIPASVVQYVYDEDSHLIGEYSGNIPIVEYIWFGDKPVAAIYGSGAATKIYYIITDHLNTPRRLVDSSNQAIVWSWDSTAFGLGNPIGSITFNLRFPGQYYDVGTNQFYNHNRFYNPELGRYMEPDPTGLGGGLNPYSYCYQNPIMFVDPNAAIPIPIITGIIGGIAGGGASALAQIYVNKGINNFNLKSVGVAASVGAVAGAISPWTATSAIGAVVTGSVASSAQYGTTQWMNNEPATVSGYTASAILGGIGGVIAGPIPKSNIIPSDVGTAFISKALGSRVNNNANFNAVVTDNMIASSFTGAAVSADIGGLGTNLIDKSINNFNNRVALNDINYNRYSAYQIGNRPNIDPSMWTGLHLEIIKEAPKY